jgi:thiamine-phosphate pyrophosphorylase
MPKPNLSLHLVIGRENCGTRSLEAIVLQAVQGGVTVVQLREKISATTTRTNIIALAKQLKQLLKPYGVLLIINDHVDIALEIDADGVHIGQQDMDYPTARKLLGPNKIIGLSVTNLQEAKAAEEYLDIDYLGVGPIFPTKTKTDATPPMSTLGLKAIKKISAHPLIVIGGIYEDNTAAVLQAGADGIAVISAICAASNPKMAALKLSKIIKDQTKFLTDEKLPHNSIYCRL